MKTFITLCLGIGLTISVMSDFSESDTGYKADMLPDTFEMVESASIYQERINEDGTISAINITQNGDIIITIKGYSYIGEIRDHELVWTRDWQGSVE